jgi:hypothetical protein
MDHVINVCNFGPKVTARCLVHPGVGGHDSAVPSLVAWLHNYTKDTHSLRNVPGASTEGKPFPCLAWLHRHASTPTACRVGRCYKAGPAAPGPFSKPADRLLCALCFCTSGLRSGQLAHTALRDRRRPDDGLRAFFVRACACVCVYRATCTGLLGPPGGTRHGHQSSFAAPSLPSLLRRGRAARAQVLCQNLAGGKDEGKGKGGKGKGKGGVR